MNLFDETGQALGGGAQGFRVYDADGHLVASSSPGGGTPGPKGDKGDPGDSIKGDKGDKGDPGAAGVLNWLGDLATAPTTPAVNDGYHNTTLGKSYVWTGAAWNVIAQDGGPGPAGGAGPGVPTGGTANQVLSKIDATNFNTQWVDAPNVTDVLKVQVFS